MTRWCFCSRFLFLLVVWSGGFATEAVDPVLEELLEPVVLESSEPIVAPAALREVPGLVAAGDHIRARRLVQAHLELQPDDLQARQLLLRIDIAERESEIRDLVAQQADLYHEVLGHPAYEAEKAVASGIDRQRLDMIEYLVGLQRYEDALRMANALLDENPEQMAALHIKHRLLERLHRRERERLERERNLRRMELMDEVSEAGFVPRDPPPVVRTVLIFDEDIAAQERESLLTKLREPIAVMQFEEASLSAVLNQLFVIADINYIVNDQALGEETLTINVQNTTVEDVLDIIQRMLPARFNYHAGSVFVTDKDSPVLVTEIYRLKSGLTDVLSQPSMSSSVSGAGGGTTGGSTRGTTGGQQAQATQAAGASSGGGGGGGGSGESDIERLMAVIEGGGLTDWPAGSRLYLDRKSNTLYIRSSPAAVAEVKRLLHAIDYNNVQVLIETKFVEVSDGAQRQLGIDWALLGREEKDGSPDSGVAWGVGSGTPLNPLEGELGLLNALNAGAGGLQFGTVGFGNDMTPNFSARLRAMEDKNEATLLSEPKILALSNSTGSISITRDIPYIADYENRSINQTVVLSDGSTSTGGTSSTLVPVPATAQEGFNLQVTPSVARNSDIITLRLAPRIDEVELRQESFNSDVSGQATPFKIEMPLVRTRTLQTTLHIRDGQTIVLGGLISEASTSGRSGVPGISDVPGLGRLFRNDTSDSRRSKLLIFVSAHIIDPSGSKYSDEVRHLRDTAQVVLPAEVQAQARAALLGEAEAAAHRQAEAAAAAEEETRSLLPTRPTTGPRARR